MCDALVSLTFRLCSEYIDPTTIESILSSRVIPLDKGNGEVRPIGVGEVIRKIIKVTEQDILESMYSLFQQEGTDAVLLVDVSNALNSINRTAAIYNMRVLCPALAEYAIIPTEHQHDYLERGVKSLSLQKVPRKAIL